MLTGNTRIGDEIGETHREYVSAFLGIVMVVWVEDWIWRWSGGYNFVSLSN